MKKITAISITDTEIKIIEAKTEQKIALDRIISREIAPDKAFAVKSKYPGKFSGLIGKVMSEENVNCNRAVIVLENKQIPLHILKLPKNISDAEIKKIIKGQLPQKLKFYIDSDIINSAQYKYVLWTAYEQKYINGIINEARRAVITKSFKIAHSLTIRSFESFSLSIIKLFCFTMRDVLESYSCILIDIQKERILIVGFEICGAPYIVKNIDISYIDKSMAAVNIIDKLSFQIKEALDSFKDRTQKYYLSMDLTIFKSAYNSNLNLLKEKINVQIEDFNPLSEFYCPPQFFSSKYLEYVRGSLTPLLGAILLQKRYKKNIFKSFVKIFKSKIFFIFAGLFMLMLIFNMLLNNAIYTRGNELILLKKEKAAVNEKIKELLTLKEINTEAEIPKNESRNIYGILNNLNKDNFSDIQLNKVKIEEGKIEIKGYSLYEKDLKIFLQNLQQNKNKFEVKKNMLKKTKVLQFTIKGNLKG